MKELVNIQNELKAPKGQNNTFGKYKYRSAEDILEAVKPLLKENKTILLLSDEIIREENRFYIKATAKLINEEGKEISVTGFAREPQDQKGMSESQITGTASSYARKYALNGLFAIDDTKDADTNEHKVESEEKEKQAVYKPKEEVKWYNDVDKNIDKWFDMVADGTTTPKAIIDKIEAQGYKLSTKNKEQIMKIS